MEGAEQSYMSGPEEAMYNQGTPTKYGGVNMMSKTNGFHGVNNNPYSLSPQQQAILYGAGNQLHP